MKTNKPPRVPFVVKLTSGLPAFTDEARVRVAERITDRIGELMPAGTDISVQVTSEKATNNLVVQDGCCDMCRFLFMNILQDAVDNAISEVVRGD